jgi:hypothetical protein
MGFPAASSISTTMAPRFETIVPTSGLFQSPPSMLVA